MPKTADMAIINMGDGVFLKAFFDIKAMSEIIASIAMPRISAEIVSPIFLKPRSVLISMVAAVAVISPTTHGRIPVRNAFTPA